VNKGVPQSPQKLRVVKLPLLARTECVFGEPAISRSTVVTMMPDANATADCLVCGYGPINLARGIRTSITVQTIPLAGFLKRRHKFANLCNRYRFFWQILAKVASANSLP
jgi:hypothetical protein